jgi:predicted transcriptional regulator
MGRISRVTAASLITLALVTRSQSATISVRVFNRAGIAAGLAAQGEKHAGDVLHRVGIDVVWVNCAKGTQECNQRPGPTSLVLTILKHGDKMASEDGLGLAVQDETGLGTYFYVFEDKLNEIAGTTHIYPSLLLGDAIAHEIGHLLKGSHSHSASGIMSGRWSKRELEAAARGALWFTEEDEAAMNAHLEEVESAYKSSLDVRADVWAESQ